LVDIVAFEEVGFFLEDELDHVLGFCDYFRVNLSMTADLLNAALGAGG
jgi:hypothetical protein